MKRVVVTGFGAVSPIGSDWETASDHLRNGRSGVRRIDAWDDYAGLQTRLGAPALGFELPPHFTRKRIRGMGRVALLAVRATELALADADLLDSPELRDGSIGAAYGSSSGGTEASVDQARPPGRDGRGRYGGARGDGGGRVRRPLRDEPAERRPVVDAAALRR